MTSKIEYKCNNCGHEGLNTRAAPDVPELVRYEDWFDCFNNGGMRKGPNGEYVRYDQAAEVIAKLTKDANHQCRERVKEFERAEAAEAELAQIKAQEPVAWRAPINPYGQKGYTYTGTEAELIRFGHHDRYPLYATPVDQTAEIERLRGLCVKYMRRLSMIGQEN